jgi:hypothetical protein
LLLCLQIIASGKYVSFLIAPVTLLLKFRLGCNKQFI